MKTPAANVLPFTHADYAAIQLYRLRFAIAGGDLSISAPGSSEIGIITEPRSMPEAADWMFWREDNGVHAERLGHGSIYLAADMRGLLDSILILSEWSVASEQGTEVRLTLSRCATSAGRTRFNPPRLQLRPIQALGHQTSHIAENCP
jgi:hypothetical protein